MRIDWYRLLPRYWLQNYPTDWEWDAILNKLLDDEDVRVEHRTLTCWLGNVEVWTSNWPYAYGYCYKPMARALPSVATRKRLRSAVGKLYKNPMDEVRAAIAAKR